MTISKKSSADPRSLICIGYIDCRKSAAEEQPQQNNHRYRHAQQPQQNSSSHTCLLQFDREKNAERGVRFPQNNAKEIFLVVHNGGRRSSTATV